MVRITGQRRPDRGTIGRSSANRDYRMSTYGKPPFTRDTARADVNDMLRLNSAHWRGFYELEGELSVARKEYYHMPPVKLLIGETLRAKAATHLDPKVEGILNTRKPAASFARSDAVYLSETTDVSKHGLTYNFGYLHIVKPVGGVQHRDSRWIGELQLRHHSNCDMRKFCDNSLATLTDEELADKYWAGTASTTPNWETVVESAVVVGLVSDDPIPIRPPEFLIPK